MSDKSRFSWALAVVLAAVLAAAAGYYAGGRMAGGGGHGAAGADEEPSGQASRKEGRKILYYRNPMNPSITSPVPAKDEMGMDYIPVYADEIDASKPAGTVRIDPVMVQKMGVRVAPAGCVVLKKRVMAPGRVEYDQERLWSVHPKFKGWVEEVFVAKAGDQVKGGEALLSIYSPELVATQQEYILSRAAGGDALRQAALERLELFGVPPSFIADLEKEGRVRRAVTLKSPGKGTVLKVGALPGDYVTPRTELYRICDLSRVWIIAEVYDQDLPWIGEGDQVEVESAAAPGRKVTGRVDFVYPEVDVKTRTVPVRVVMDNRGGVLRPGMFVDVAILSGTGRRVLAVPSEAVVRSGKERRVFVMTGPGIFEPRTVVTGVEAEGMVEIVRGLSHGEQVVVSAQFLIDSESKLKEAASKMMRKGLAGGGAGPASGAEGAR